VAADDEAEGEGHGRGVLGPVREGRAAEAGHVARRDDAGWDLERPREEVGEAGEPGSAAHQEQPPHLGSTRLAVGREGLVDLGDEGVERVAHGRRGGDAADIGALCGREVTLERLGLGLRHGQGLGEGSREGLPAGEDGPAEPQAASPHDRDAGLAGPEVDDGGRPVHGALGLGDSVGERHEGGGLELDPPRIQARRRAGLEELRDVGRLRGRGQHLDLGGRGCMGEPVVRHDDLVQREGELVLQLERDDLVELAAGGGREAEDAGRDPVPGEAHRHLVAAQRPRLDERAEAVGERRPLLLHGRGVGELHGPEGLSQDDGLDRVHADIEADDRPEHGAMLVSRPPGVKATR
jgi:hypothetical protein